MSDQLNTRIIELITQDFSLENWELFETYNTLDEICQCVHDSPIGGKLCFTFHHDPGSGFYFIRNLNGRISLAFLVIVDESGKFAHMHIRPSYLMSLIESLRAEGLID